MVSVTSVMTTARLDLILDCLLIMVQGMVGIFVVILVIWALVAILNRVTGKKKDDPSGSGKG